MADSHAVSGALSFPRGRQSRGLERSATRCSSPAPGEFNIRELVFDPWRFSQGAQELEREGILVTAFPQTDVRMMPASDRLYRAIVDRRLTLPDNAELRAHAHAAIAKHSRRGWRIDKSQRSDNIDAVIAICMALDSVENQPPAVELLGWL